ncbi:3963_t:CDS:2 [Entrophospora sp. SA101]|nr:3963_t:CDS:2 [Entrophospora sp. SA101]
MGPINPTPSKSQDVQSNDNSVSQVDFKKLYDIVVGLKETMAGSKQTLSKKPGQPEDGYDYDPIEDLRLQFEQLGVNQAMARVIHAVFKKSSKHSSNSGASSSDNDSNTGVSSDSDGPESESENITEIVQNIINTAKAKKRRNSGASMAKPNLIDKSLQKLYQILPVPEILDEDEEESLEDHMEIDFVQKKETTTSIATIKCKIKCLKIPAMELDSTAELAITSEDFVKRIGEKIDKSEKYDLSGIATIPTESIGVVRNLPITFLPDWAKDELKIPFNGEDFIIPVTMHKVKNKLEVNCVAVVENTDTAIPDQISQEMGEPLKKHMNCEELEKSLYKVLDFNTKLIDANKILRMRMMHSVAPLGL